MRVCIYGPARMECDKCGECGAVRMNVRMWEMNARGKKLIYMWKQPWCETGGYVVSNPEITVWRLELSI